MVSCVEVNHLWPCCQYTNKTKNKTKYSQVWTPVIIFDRKVAIVVSHYETLFWEEELLEKFCLLYYCFWFRRCHSGYQYGNIKMLHIHTCPVYFFPRLRQNMFRATLNCKKLHALRFILNTVPLKSMEFGMSTHCRSPVCSDVFFTVSFLLYLSLLKF